MNKLFLLLILIAPISINAQTSVPSTFFPKIEGWNLDDTSKIYSGDNLWNIIDGAADNFLKFSFEEMQMVNYTRPDSSYIVVESYKHATPDYAFGIYSQERPNKGNYMKAGTEGYEEPGMLNFFTSNYYIKLRSVKTDDYVQQAIRKIAQGIASRINSTEGFPEILKSFPGEGKVDHSEKFVAKNFLGYSFFENVFQANYDVDANSFNVFLVKRDDAAQIDEILTHYYSLLKKSFKKNIENMYNVKDPYNGNITLIVKGNVLGGIYNLDNSKLRKHYTELLNKSMLNEK
jgi:hypothetical protein